MCSRICSNKQFTKIVFSVCNQYKKLINMMNVKFSVFHLFKILFQSNLSPIEQSEEYDSYFTESSKTNLILQNCLNLLHNQTVSF